MLNRAEENPCYYIKITHTTKVTARKEMPSSNGTVLEETQRDAKSTWSLILAIKSLVLSEIIIMILNSFR